MAIVDMYSGPSIGGEFGFWGPWYHSEGLIVASETSFPMTFDFSILSEAPSPY